MSGGYYGTAVTSAKQHRTNRPVRKIRKEQMKLSLKQRIRNWLMTDELDMAEVCVQDIEPARLDSEGMRLQVYKASGGYVIETRSYDQRTDRHNNTMHVVTDDEDLGDRIGKIIMMEALRG
jgi:hypothetical protein